MNDETGPETLLVGIDAGCLPVFERLFEDDVVPTLERICTDGVAGPLDSQVPPWTPSAWPSIYTGVNPGKHGIHGFVGYEGYDFHVVSADHVREHSLWSLLDQRDLSSVVVNVPVTSPPDAIDGAVIPGFIGPEDPLCHPAGLLEDVREEIGEYRIYPAYTKDDREYTKAEKLAEYRSLVRMRGEAFRYLADRFAPDFGFLQFQKPDTVFHEFGDWTSIKQVYEETDQQIGRTLDACDPDRVFVVSDHGIGRYRGERFHVNDFLRERGYVETTTGGKGMPSWGPIRNQLREGSETETWEPGAVSRLAGVAAQFGITARRVNSLLKQVGLSEVVKEYVPDAVGRTANEQVDFQASTAYMRARAELGVRINVRGRDPAGVVDPAEYDTVREELMAALREATTPDGDPVFDEVAPREEYIHGPYADDAVDIVTMPRNFEQFLSAELFGSQFSPLSENHWDHRYEGVFAAYGDVDVDADLTGAQLFDVAPTVMAALGLPYSDRMDGSVIPVVPSRGTDPYPVYEAGEETAVEAGVEDRLADLGYL